MGYGVFATQPIPKGTFIWVLDFFDRILTPAEVGALQPGLRTIVDRYSYQATDGNFVFCWDFGRYMNHSCEPAGRGVGDAFEVAIRDIEPGEQLTCEYGTLNLLHALTCRCGAPSCRGTVRRDDAERHFELWDAQASSAFALAGMGTSRVRATSAADSLLRTNYVTVPCRQQDVNYHVDVCLPLRHGCPGR